METIDKKQFAQFVADIKTKIREAQYEALRAVNRQLIDLYWSIGRSIVEKQEAFGWGKSVVEKLSAELQAEFGGMQGFSARNLWNMRDFYRSYVGHEILQPMVAEISWAKNLVIMSKCKDTLQREFYIRMTKKYGWTKAVLVHQIEGRSYESYLLNQTNFDQTLPENIRNQAKLAVKDEYTFDFLQLADAHAESELELALIRNIRRFLIEMGGDYTFIGNQFRLEVGGKDYHVDLLLFHRRLRCLVAIDLKIDEFEPEHKGKMEFYLNVLNDTVKLADENDSIGIIICKSKNRTVVEYALKTASHPMGIATYTITNQLPEAFARFLPSEADIAERLRLLEEDA